ncbi:MAG: 4Fe-4S dicluster domain-containing protein [Polyangia bacterium]
MTILRKLFSLAEAEDLPTDRGLVDEGQPAFGFFTDTTLCIGCKACEVACKQWNQLPADGFRFTGHSYDNTSMLSATTWRHVAFNEQVREPPGDSGPAVSRWLMLSDVCKHCAQAPCQQSCPTGAILYNEFGDVYVQSDICNGCGYCVVACPFGVLSRSEEDGRAHKCTLCYDRQKGGLTPACAKACPTESIQFGPLDVLRQRAWDRLAELQGRGVHKAALYGAEATPEYSALNAFFLITDHPNAYNLPEAPRRPHQGMLARYVASVGTGLLLAGIAALCFARGR